MINDRRLCLLYTLGENVFRKRVEINRFQSIGKIAVDIFQRHRSRIIYDNFCGISQRFKYAALSYDTDKGNIDAISSVLRYLAAISIFIKLIVPLYMNVRFKHT